MSAARAMWPEGCLGKLEKLFPPEGRNIAPIFPWIDHLLMCDDDGD